MRAKLLSGVLFFPVVFVIVLLLLAERSYAPPPSQNTPPIAVVTAEPNRAFEGKIFRFDGSDSSDPDPDQFIVKYAWDFGDGNSYTEECSDGNCLGYVDYAYATEDTYEVTLTVTDSVKPPSAALTDSNEQTVYVDALYEVPDEYSTIQEAIDAANDFDLVEVGPGVYYESIEFPPVSERVVRIRSTDPYDWDVVKATVIDANGADVGVLFDCGESSYYPIMEGFTVRNADTAGIRCISSNPRITRCIVEDNEWSGIRADDCIMPPKIISCLIRNNNNMGVNASLSTLQLYNSVIFNNPCGVGLIGYYDRSLLNNTIVGNYEGVWTYYADNPDIRNCVFWDNVDALIGCSATYSRVPTGDLGDPNITHNIDADPLLVEGDEFYHLQLGSPCIDAGCYALSSQLSDIDGDYRYLDGDGDGDAVVDMGADEVLEPVIVCLAFIDETGGGSYYSYPSRYNEDLEGYRDLLPTLEFEVHSRCIVPLYDISLVLPDGCEPPDEISVETCNRPPDCNELMAHFAEVCGDDAEPTRICLCVDVSGSMFTEIVALQEGYDEFVAELRARYGEELVVEYPFGNPIVPDERWVLAMTEAVSMEGPVHNITQDTYYFSIQPAINEANDTDEIIVAPGTYYESIDFLGKPITLQSFHPPMIARSFCPPRWDIVEDTVIDANGADQVVELGSGADGNLLGFTITGASSGYYAAVYCNWSNPTIRYCRIVDNSGRGLLCSSGSPKIRTCIISGNGNLSESYGGGIWCGINSSPSIINSLISDNEGVKGGGIGCGYYARPYIRNCTIAGNVASEVGGGLYIDMDAPAPGQPEINNSIIFGNSAYILFGSIAGDTSTISYSLVWGCDGSGDDWDSTFGIDGGGNIDEMAKFEQNDPLYHLRPDSPCRETGDPVYRPDPNEPDETDIDGQPRVYGERVDMGSDEWWLVSN
ncbi:MAG: right-handed parallel beta-helix repeat-containing protein [Planctomycetota bacterium]|nr:MAG: right-handed parallel beta-helix repeat-containing protein [Planctomycetota bacterium]